MQTSDLPRLVFLGYQVKVPWKPDPKWDPENKTGVVEVCSVSECITKRPPDWIEHWTHNRAWCYSTPGEALATIPAGESDSYDLFAYWVAPRTFDDGSWKDLDPDDLFQPDQPPLPGDPGPTNCDVLGFDVVTWEYREFVHSPLSCNLMAQDFKVNRFCLVPDLEEALRLVQAFTNEKCEPGPYLAVRVARVPR